MWYSNYWGCLPFCGKMTKSKLNKFENNLEFQNVFENLYSLALNQYAPLWKNLPDTVDPLFLERSLLLYGKALIADFDGVKVALAGANASAPTLNGWYTRAYGWGMNGFNQEFRTYVPYADSNGALLKSADGSAPYYAPNAVLGYDNPDGYPYINYIIQTAKRLSDLMRSCDVAIANLKSPYYIACDETQVKSVEEAIKARDNNDTAIISSPSITLENFKIWPTGVSPDTPKTFWEQRQNVLSSHLETFGTISNPNTDKRERLLVDEINANNELTMQNYRMRLKWRQLLADWMNDLWGTNVSIGDDDYDNGLYDIGGMDDSVRDDANVRGDADRRGDSSGDI